MSELRSRQQVAQRQKDQTNKRKTQNLNVDGQLVDNERKGLLGVLGVYAGIACMLALGYIHAKHVATIHENWMWFSNIKVMCQAKLK